MGFPFRGVQFNAGTKVLTGNGVHGAKVTVYAEDTSKKNVRETAIASGVVDSTGTFSITCSSLVTGTYTLRVGADCLSIPITVTVP